MFDTESYRAVLPVELYEQISALCSDVHLLQSEANEILRHNKVPDATQQLNNVLLSTEEATNTIIDSATAMQSLIDKSTASDADKQHVAALVTKLYEACNFQDLTGQRIQKVLKNFGTLEARLVGLAEMAKKYAPPGGEAVAAPEEVVLAGPSLTQDAPSQEDIDALMASFG